MSSTVPNTALEPGVIYLAFGRPFLAMAVNSVLSLRISNPRTPFCIVTNVCETPPPALPWRDGIDRWTFMNIPTGENRLIKTSIFDHSPFEKTLYLDCDTVVVGDISPASFILDYFDLGLMSTTGAYYREKRDIFLFDGNRPCHEFPHWNSGVVLFRKNDATKEMFSTWNDCFRKLGTKLDQPSLVEAIFKSQCRIVSLDLRWNNSDRMTGGAIFARRAFRDQTVIWHYKTEIDGPLFRDLVAADKIIESSPALSTSSETLDYLNKRSGRGWSFRPRRLLRNLIRRVRGRLPDRLLSQRPPSQPS